MDEGTLRMIWSELVSRWGHLHRYESIKQSAVERWYSAVWYMFQIPVFRATRDVIFFF